MNESEILDKYLLKRGLRLTNQRETILRVFLDNEGHFSAEEFYDKVKIADKNIGQATVFRTLKLFAEAGIADRVEFNDKTFRYEHKVNHAHHDHLICEKCGKVIEFTNDKIEDLQKMICSENGFVMKSHRFEIFGICPECNK